VLTKAGYDGPIYTTPASAEVARIVLEDAGEIQEEDAQYLNQRSRQPGEPQVEPLFRRVDVHDVLKQLRRVKYGQRTVLNKNGAEGFAFTFFDAGHILGSAYVLIEFNEKGEKKTLLFTGDVGRYNTPILRDPVPPPGPANLVITESTYGNKKHGPIEEVEPQLLELVKGFIERRSRLLVPAFAVGRTQTMLWYFQKFIHEQKIPQIPIYVDSPMGVEVSQVHIDYPDNFDEQTRTMLGKQDLFGLTRVTFASSSQQSREINRDRGPCVIIASSPTCEFGRILHHLKQSVENPNDTVVFCGWIPPHTLGRRLQDRESRVRIFDRWYDVRCRIETIHGLSAHADGDELLRFLQPALAPHTTAFVVHGEEDQAEFFARRLLEKGIHRAEVPAMEGAIVTSTEGLYTPTPERDEQGRRAATDGD
jgi:metallo-beta-lactamase family protein